MNGASTYKKQSLLSERLVHELLVFASTWVTRWLA